jgi:hypothetical protein
MVSIHLAPINPDLKVGENERSEARNSDEDNKPLKWFSVIAAPFNPDLKVGENERLESRHAKNPVH